MQQKNVHWYPGHMVKAIREIQNRLPVIDVVIEVVDSRCPISAKNPFLDDIIKNKKRLIVFTKKDLCDLEALTPFYAYYQQRGYQTYAADLNNPNDIKNIVRYTLDLGNDTQEKYLRRGMKKQPLRVMVIGIPNAGKSTLINRLAKRNAAGVQNTPGHTKAQQWIRINENFELLDTPGILPPHYEDEQIALHLAYIGSIKDIVLPLDQIYEGLINFLILHYPDGLIKRYNINKEDLSFDKITIAIGSKRKIITRGGLVDEDGVKRLVIKEFRAGLIAKVVVDNAGL